ncbi:hypothetical protein RB599_010095 [Gaeumannomyces hyphopodioides]
MVSVDALKSALRQQTAGEAPRAGLSDLQYSQAHHVIRTAESGSYNDFIFPQLSYLVAALPGQDGGLSVLEIGPGPETALASMPDLGTRRRVVKYEAYECNSSFAEQLEAGLRPRSKLPGLERPPTVHRRPFDLDLDIFSCEKPKFDLVLFCRSMYGMNPKARFVEKAVQLLTEGGIVAVFHPDETLDLPGLLCHQIATWPEGCLALPDDNQALAVTTSFLAGYCVPGGEASNVWRALCRHLGRRDEKRPGELLFDAPQIMVAFNKSAGSTAGLPVGLLVGETQVKNREASLRRPADVARPTTLEDIQQIVRWAISRVLGLTVIGGGHSSHCQQPGILALDMRSFDKTQIIRDHDMGRLLVAGTGCTSGSIIEAAMAEGLAVPLGSRPSVGAGLWLQGGIGHLSRRYGLTCDAIIGAVVVSPIDGRVLRLGRVPNEFFPSGAEDSSYGIDLLWALKGSGTNFFIVVSVVFKTVPNITHDVRNWDTLMGNAAEAHRKLAKLDETIGNLERTKAADVYLFSSNGQPRLGTTLYSPPAAGEQIGDEIKAVTSIVGHHPQVFKEVDGMGLFGTDMYMKSMHGGHGGNKFSAFKRCVFLKDISDRAVRDELLAALDTRPSPYCYIHLVHAGGGAVSDVEASATAFGCRNWRFACNITGVWRCADDDAAARACTRWVYDVAHKLLPMCSGVYGADLGPDPRDAALATRAFGPNRERLARLKRVLDPHRVLPFACPLVGPPSRPRLVVAVTGAHGAGKDFCAAAWASALIAAGVPARVASISGATKRAYAAATPGVDAWRLLADDDRDYKEQHRAAMVAFYSAQLAARPGLPEELFAELAGGVGEAEVLFVTGMRDEAPVATRAHLAPWARVIEVRVVATPELLAARRGPHAAAVADDGPIVAPPPDWRPCLVFNNNAGGPDGAAAFARSRILPLLDPDVDRLRDMVPGVPGFPHAGVEFRHVLSIAERPGGLRLCTSLLQGRLRGGGQPSPGAVVGCEAGGFVLAAGLAAALDVPLRLVRKVGKLPPPTVSVPAARSHISSAAAAGEKQSGDLGLEMACCGDMAGRPVVVVDDVLASGTTLRAVLELLAKNGVEPRDVKVLVVAEFPAHRGREALRRSGFGMVSAESLLTFEGA